MAGHDIAIRRARAMVILRKKIHENKSNAAVAKDIHVSIDTVRREIDWAKRQGLVARFEDQILERLVPKSIDACETALADGDTHVALEIMKGIGLLRKQSDRPLLRPEAEVQEESLEIHVKRISSGTAAGESTQSQLTPTTTAGLLEGVVLSDSAGGGTPATASELQPVRSEAGATELAEYLGTSADAA